jgi:hypothetical protein
MGSTNCGEEEFIEDIDGESQKEKYHWEDQDLGGWTLSKYVLQK